MKGCIIRYIVRIFSSLELVEPHIIPPKARLPVALKEEAYPGGLPYERGRDARRLA